jgi:ribosomal protein S6
MLGLNTMRTYELILVIKTSLTEALRKKLVAGIKVLLGDLKVVKENEAGQKTLAYKIKRETNGYYFDFSLEGENVPADFEKKLLENDNILRHLLLRTK